MAYAQYCGPSWASSWPSSPGGASSGGRSSITSRVAAIAYTPSTNAPSRPQPCGAWAAGRKLQPRVYQRLSPFTSGTLAAGVGGVDQGEGVLPHRLVAGRG